ncbi:MAG: hypothetical protein LBE34_14665 [Flavobacteriaceae bacterium]|jgi:hypothetical protein|nr:hypothetical protein [Flavobacteriaceae bacterium]
MITIFYTNYLNSESVEDVVVSKEECLTLFSKIMNWPDNFLGITINQEKTIQFYREIDNILVDLINLPELINHQMYANKKECMDMIAEVFDTYSIKTYPQMKLVDTMKESLDDVINKG